MKYIIILFMFLLIPLVHAESTFFDNPDDVFIANSHTASGTTEKTIEEITDTSRGCMYKWNCTNWSECLPSEKQTRKCTNIGGCSSSYRPPETEQHCVSPSFSPKISGEEKEEPTGGLITGRTITETKFAGLSILGWIVILVIVAIVLFLIGKKLYTKFKTFK